MIRIEIKTDNAAFDVPGGNIEIARILRIVAARIIDIFPTNKHPNNWEGFISLIDINGNKVGECEFSELEPDIAQIMAKLEGKSRQYLVKLWKQLEDDSP